MKNMDMEGQADSGIRQALPVTPRATVEVLTGPIGFLAKEKQTPAGEKFKQAVDLMYGSSQSVSQPINEIMVSDVIRSGIAKTQELIQAKGNYANTEEGKYAQGWLMQLNEADHVISGQRQDSRPLHYIIDQISSVRIAQAADEVKAAGKSGLGISPNGELLKVSYENSGSEKKQAEGRLDRINRENLAVKDWITTKFKEPS